MPNDFENTIAATFRVYAEKRKAVLAMMPVPIKQVGAKGGMPIYVRAGKAPFDVYGWEIGSGRMIGAELKSSGRKKSLPIVAPASRGDGLQYHQLASLAELVADGGHGLVVWDNGGEVGVLRGPALTNAFRTYEHAMKSGVSGRSVKRGSKSIPWGTFEVVEWTVLGQSVAPDWLVLQ